MTLRRQKSRTPLESLLDGLELQPGDNNEPKKKTSLH